MRILGFFPRFFFNLISPPSLFFATSPGDMGDGGQQALLAHILGMLQTMQRPVATTGPPGPSNFPDESPNSPSHASGPSAATASSSHPITAYPGTLHRTSPDGAGSHSVSSLGAFGAAVAHATGPAPPSQPIIPLPNQYTPPLQIPRNHTNHILLPFLSLAHQGKIFTLGCRQHKI
ncbi:hypothetical protein BS47DRAFT_141577 [Hydnum rufescens UP504]|uniref:Uncharacterized protein n=1 Tax=Hydnum rufescens UP504 TaxID=1448309 RepID=A0A9P6APH9_9AGAM|nr:hypothetical protein BS47DRAFT_141577 [Hydnum rufescens UP504]